MWDRPPEDTSSRRGYVSRDVFVDTNVFRRAGMNLDQKLFRALASKCEDFGFRIHMSEIVLRECDAQILEYANDVAKAFRAYEKAATRWNFQARRAEEVRVGRAPDVSWNASMQSANFRRRLTDDFGMIVHGFDEIDAGAILEGYFAGREPFRNGKTEFPDAMIVQIAARHGMRAGTPSYLISGDKAILAACVDQNHVVGVPSLEAFLALDETLDEDVRTLADDLFRNEANPLHETIMIEISNAAEGIDLVYAEGDVDDVEIKNVHHSGPLKLHSVTPIFHDGKRLSAVAEVSEDLELDVTGELPDPGYQGDYEEGPPPSYRERVLMEERNVAYRAFVTVDLEAEEVEDCQILTETHYIRSSFMKALRDTYW
ncbi:PIN domain-containing protein [Aurantimonas marina]|uniref:PIN domain-containing protein n=1 Tax=Aurantimonas marina TaxID=2780508 RepID=UPI0019D1B5D2|nr:PIN domain-containing protein [Aurantimonas marina]